MKKTALLIGVASLIFITGCSQSQSRPAIPAATPPTATAPAIDVSTPTTSSNTKNITIANFQFSSATLEVAIGETVTRTNNDSVAHSVVADDELFNSAALQQGESFSYTFSKAGTYAYHCVPHLNMKGIIVVK